ERRAKQYPFLKPLNLSKQARVGVVRCSASKTFSVHFNSTSGVCSRERFNSTAVSDLAVKGNLTADTQCTALQADPEGRAGLHSCSCRVKMLSLLSFSETPSFGSESGKMFRSGPIMVQRAGQDSDFAAAAAAKRKHMCSKQLLAFLLLIAVSQTPIRGTLAERHQCHSSGHLLQLRDGETETLDTRNRDQSELTASQTCLWEVKPPANLIEPGNFILKIARKRGGSEAAMPDGNPPSCDWSLTVELTGNSQLLTVRFSTGDFELSASCGRIELTIAVAKKGFCGRHMLLHRGRCLFISDLELRLSDLSGTGVELAAISGTEQLHELMRDRTSPSHHR
uniref:CUB domain-containing protein n=1 Tax=Macrostomum lignano TaxID=282301 RepID=A0A1I8GUX1_9PLAT